MNQRVGFRPSLPSASSEATATAAPAPQASATPNLHAAMQLIVRDLTKAFEERGLGLLTREEFHAVGVVMMVASQAALDGAIEAAVELRRAAK